MGKVKGLGLNISDLVHKHKGEAAVIIGGAPSRLSDQEFWPKQAVFISANDHGLKQTTCNYSVCCEDLEHRLRQHNVKVISRHSWADYRVFDKPIPNSGVLAAYSAWVMGCAPIIITGVECYQGKTYADDPKAHSSGFNVSLKDHLKRWGALRYMAMWGQFRCVSGPLVHVFDKYKPDEPAFQPASREFILKECEGKKVRMLRSEVVGRREYSKGTTVEVEEIEAHALVRAHSAKRLGT